MTDTRFEQIAKNEALFRRINHEVEELNRALAEISDRTFHIVCECGSLICQTRLVVPVSAYEAVRADPTLFLVLPGHEIPSAEDVIETDTAYNVVRKHPGLPKQIARATDPRATTLPQTDEPTRVNAEPLEVSPSTPAKAADVGQRYGGQSA